MKHNILKLVLANLVLIISFQVNAQHTYYTMGHNMNIDVNKTINKIKEPVNTGFKPLLKSDFNKYVDVDSVLYQYDRAKKFFSKHKKNWFYRKFMFEDFVYVSKPKFRLSINPLLYVESGKYQDASGNYLINTRGVELKGDLGSKLSFYSAFRENQATFQPYVNDWVKNRLVSPGQGATKPFGDDKLGHDFSSATAYLSYTPFDWLNLQLGYDKNFIGEGYRSLLLSDNSFNYPFVKLSANYKGFKYTTLVTKFEDFETVYYYYHFKKHAAFNYLSYSFNNRIEVGLFEGIIYHTTDTTAGYINKIPADYFIPVMGVRSGINGLSSEHNAMLGVNLKLKINDYIQVYGQSAIDDFADDRYAWQAGFKVFDVFHSKLENHNLYIQAEYNTADSKTYSFPDLKYQTWSHYNQELAHPLGNSFSETVAIVNYRFHNLFVNFKYTNAEINKNSSLSVYIKNEDAANINAAEISHKTITAGWTINPRYYLQIYGGIDIRSYSIGDDTKKNNYIMFGIRTGLNNSYYDF